MHPYNFLKDTDFSEKAEHPMLENPDYQSLRRILKSLLEKHQNDPNYDTFEWQK